MTTYKNVLVKMWGEETASPAIVGIGLEIDQFFDDRVYFYFEDEAEFERAKLPSDEFSFQITETEE